MAKELKVKCGSKCGEKECTHSKAHLRSVMCYGECWFFPLAKCLPVKPKKKEKK